MSSCRSIQKLNYSNIIFFVTLLALSVTALPWYALHVGISRSEWILCLVLVFATGLSITVGYHRLFAHRSFQTNPVVIMFGLVFGAAAFEQSALMWASLHRDHHRYVDTERDPYNIKQGFWYAHIGWILFRHTIPNYANVADLRANPLIMHQHRHYLAWAACAGILLPLAIGAATGHLLGAFLLCVVGRLTFVHHTTWSINSICHTFGKATYDIDATARDHWLVAFLTGGEGYHNYHHRFASDYRNGIRWYQWDPSKWIIALLQWCGLARKLYRATPQAILAAKMAAEHLRVERALDRRRGPDIAAVMNAVRERYAALKTALYEWERLEKEYRRVRESVTERSQLYLQSVRQQFEGKRRTFVETRQRWIQFINTNPLIPQAAHI